MKRRTPRKDRTNGQREHRVDPMLARDRMPSPDRVSYGELDAFGMPLDNELFDAVHEIHVHRTEGRVL